MVSFGATIHAAELPESNNNFDLIPPGVYAAMVEDVEAKDTKAGDGQYINITWILLDEPYNNRKVWQMVFLRHPKENVVEIGLKQLGEIMRAVGMVSISDSDELIGKNALIKLKIEAGKDGYDDKNKVVAVKALEGSAPPSAAPAAAVKPASPPWGAKR